MKKISIGLKHLVLFSATGFLASFSTLESATKWGVHSDITFFGSNPTYRAQTVAADKTIHAQVSRNSLLWQLIESQQGTLNWSTPDSVVSVLVANGIEPLFVIKGSPSWANGMSTSTANYDLYVPQDPTAFSTWVNRYATFVSAAVSRYKSNVHKWEIGNEANTHFFWKPAPNVDQYATWFTAIDNAIHTADPSAQVALGGLTELTTTYRNTQDYTGNQFLLDLYARSIFPEIVAIHPYPGHDRAPDTHQTNDNNFDDIQLIRDTMIAHGQSDKPMWITEWGWDVTVVGESTQAEYVQTSLQMIRNLYSFVTLATYFIDADKGTHTFGLLRSDFSIRPAGKVFQDFVPSTSPQNDLSSVRVFPNPWRSREDNNLPITFDHLTAGSTVKIFDTAGHWVRTVTPVGGSATWDLRDSSAHGVASGLYFYLAEDGNGATARGPFTVIK